MNKPKILHVDENHPLLLEGLKSLDAKFVIPLIHSSDARLASNALRVSEPWLQASHKQVLEAYQKI